MPPVCLLAICLLAVCLLAAGCSPGGKRLEKPARSILWVEAGTQVDFRDLAALNQVGIGELFVEAGALTWEGALPRIEPLPLLSMPRRTGVTLVIRGQWPERELDSTAVAEVLARDLEALTGHASKQGLVAVGVHFDVDASASLAGYGKALSALQAELPEPLYLSASVARAWVRSPLLGEVAGAVDFLVAFLYGQRPGEPDDDNAWELRQVEQSLRLLEELDRGYLVGVVTLGRTQWREGRGTVLGETTTVSLGELVHNPALELSMGFTLQGVDRMVYSFLANSPTRVGEWSVRRGQTLRSVFLSSFHLEEFDRRIGVLDLDHFLGGAYYRLGVEGEGMALSVANLVAALGPEPAVAKPRAWLREVSRRGGSRLVQVVLENAADEPSDILPSGRYNYVELRVEGGSIGNIIPGDFSHYDILAPNAKGELVRAFRNVPILHLYTPLLEGGERLVSGPVEVRLRSPDATLSLGGQFLVPGGGVVEVLPMEEEQEGG